MSFNCLEERLELRPGTISSLLNDDHSKWYARRLVRPRRHFAGFANAHAKGRSVVAPCDDLRSVQSKLKELISSRFRPHPLAHAYAKGRSIITNAERHLHAKAILNLDLVNFFGTITQSSVSVHLHRVLNEFGSPDVETIAALCCYGSFLPQGAVTSPILSNLACYSLDVRLAEIEHSFGCRITRYSDDISISSTDELFLYRAPSTSLHVGSEFIRLVEKLRAVIQTCGFTINERKWRLRAYPQPLTVTGIRVEGDHLKVPSEFRHNIRAMLCRWERDGISALPRDPYAGTVERCRHALRGRIAYLGQVQGKGDVSYRRLLAKFDALDARDPAPT